jgi:hypothetical protein
MADQRCDYRYLLEELLAALKPTLIVEMAGRPSLGIAARTCVSSYSVEGALVEVVRERLAEASGQ